MARTTPSKKQQANRQDPDRSVITAWMTSGNPMHDYTQSMIAMRDWDSHHEHYLVGDIAQMSSPRIAETRCSAVDKFLTSNECKNANWLLMIDADMSFEPDTLSRMMQFAKFPDVAVLGAYTHGGYPGRGSRIFPTIYHLDSDEQGLKTKTWQGPVPRNALFKVGGTGAAFLLMHRQVLADMLVAFGQRRDGTSHAYPWFEETSTSGSRGYGEDITFCHRAMALGYPVWVTSSVEIAHVKPYPMTSEDYHSYLNGLHRKELRSRIERNVEDRELRRDLLAFLDDEPMPTYYPEGGASDDDSG